ncbi:MAG: VCBS repeat-containing protein [Thermoplasmatales archaeon]|nr:MAG: VCBS repeat-containing protein [Thermoplasmatales archaeon]
MKNKLLKKGLAIELMILFVVASLVPIISGNVGKTSYIDGIEVDIDAVKTGNLLIDEYQEGWPQTILGDPNLWGGIISPVVDDLDNDNEMELILTQQADPVKLYVFNNNGTLKFPIIEIPGYISPRSFTSIADIDNDGFKEIIVDVQNKIAIYGSDGILEDLWVLDYQASDGSIYRAPVIADLNNDDTLELIYTGWYLDGSRLIVLNNSGVTMPGFPVLLENIQMSEANMPAVGNFDGDDDLEIVVISHENNQPTDLSNIRAFNCDGSLLWDQQIDAIVFQSPSVGDVNNDGYDEVVFTSEKGVHILDRFGNYSVNNELGVDGLSSNVALANLNDDEYLEIIFGYLMSYSVMTHTGDILWSYNTGYVTHYPPVVEDITGDNIPDIVVTSDFEVFAWDSQGTAIPGFPKTIVTNAYGACSVADIDNDNDVELIVSGDYNWIQQQGKNYNEGIIYIWDLSGTYNSSAMEWPMFQHDQLHTGRYKKDIVYNNPPDVPDIDGPTNGPMGTLFTYTFNSIDPENDDVYYYIKWGDGNTEDWNGPYSSGVDIDIEHAYLTQGTFTIEAKAKDIHDAESNWSEFEVEIPRFKANKNLIIFRFLEMFPILRYLLGF